MSLTAGKFSFRSFYGMCGHHALSTELIGTEEHFGLRFFLSD